VTLTLWSIMLAVDETPAFYPTPRRIVRNPANRLLDT